MTISADCTIQDGANPPESMANGVDVTPAATITIALASTAGVDVWSIAVVGTDELVASPTLTVNSTTKTATFTAPAAGSALLFESTVTSNNGRDPATGRSPYVKTARFKVSTLSSGARVLAIGETFENDEVFGWIQPVNNLIRTGGGGGGSTPTGTGIPHVVGGVQDAAASLIVNADVNAAAGIVGSKLAAVLAVTTAVSAGTNPAAAGPIRIPYQGYLTSRNSGNSADFPLISNDNGDYVTLGDASANNGFVLKSFGAGNIYLRFGGTDAITIVFNALKMNAPIHGDDANSSPYGVHGTGTVAEGDTTRTEVAAIYKYAHVIYTGAMTAGRTVTYPLPASLAASFHKTIFNNTTGGFAITLANGGGAVVPVAAGKTALLAFEPAGVRRLTADV